MSDLDFFYKNGFYLGEFKKTKNHQKFINILKELYDYKINHGYRFEKKYSSSEDFRPNIYSYNDIFLEILKENKIDSILNKFSQNELDCMHIQLRRTLPGKAYLNWHRDAYYHNGKKTGNLPPIFKLIYYPYFNGEPKNQIEISIGSNRRNIDNKYIDYVNNFFFKKLKIKSDNQRFLIFDTSIFHRVFKEQNSNGSLRLIYSFGNKYQNKKYDQDLIKQYRALRN